MHQFTRRVGWWAIRLNFCVVGLVESGSRWIDVAAVVYTIRYLRVAYFNLRTSAGGQTGSDVPPYGAADNRWQPQSSWIDPT